MEYPEVFSSLGNDQKWCSLQQNTLALYNIIIYIGKSTTRYHQMNDFVLSFYLVFWTVLMTILRPTRTDHDHEGNVMMQPASLLQWHPPNISILNSNASNHCQMIWIHPLPSKGWICIVSATKVEHGRSFNRRIHTMYPTMRAKTPSVNGWRHLGMQ